MSAKLCEKRENTVQETVARFLRAVKKGDSKSFWDILDKKGQGYFLGIWFYAMESMRVGTIMKLTEEDKFMDGVLGPIMEGLRESMGGLLESPLLGEVHYRSPHSAIVTVSPAEANSPDRNPDGDSFIPLVLELADPGDTGGNPSLTCWKIDTLQCFELNRGVH